MMDGYFRVKKFSKYSNIVGIISGLSLIVLFGFLMFVDLTMTIDDIIGGIFFIIFGFFAFCFSSISLFYNSNAFLHMENNRITARFNWKTKLECDYSEIVFIEYGFYTLFIRLRNGKQYTIHNIENAESICFEIRKKLYDSITINDKEKLHSEMIKLSAIRKNQLILIILGIVIIFVSIFVCATYTGEKELSDFTKNEWLIFIIFVVWELLITSFVFYISNKCGKILPVINEKRGKFKKLILESEPTPSGNVKLIYIDNDLTCRLTVYEIPSANDVYYIVEELDKNYA